MSKILIVEDEETIADLEKDYLELSGLQRYEDLNPLLETTPYFEKFTFPGDEDSSMTVTIGYYEGIRELFLKVGK